MGWALLSAAPLLRIDGLRVSEGYLYALAPGVTAWSVPIRFRGPVLAAVGIFDGGRWWVSGGPDLQVSDDAGEHWRIIGRSPAGQFGLVTVVDGNHVWAVLFACQGGGRVCRTSLARSVDGGRHWSTVSLPV